jgi:predicted nucleic acid-binding protein
MPSVLVDTSVWYAIFDPRDGKLSTDQAIELLSKIRVHSVIIPWPVAYETLRSSFVKNKAALARFELELKSPRVEFIDDSIYREQALALCFESSLRGKRPLSMADCLLRLILEDTNTRITYLATLDLADFSDVCRSRQIEILQ